jgi:hypothetical protein
MMRQRLGIFVVAALAVVTSSCAATDLRRMDDQLESAIKTLDSLPPDNPTAISQRAVLTQLSDQAATKAHEESKSDGVMAAAFYRVACVAAWEARSASVTTLSHEGSQVCASLPKQDNSAPRDCALIKLSEPYAVAAEQMDKTSQLTQQLAGLRQTNRRALFPSTEATPINEIFMSLANQFDKVSNIRASMSGDVPDNLKTDTDNERRTIYCAAGVASNLAGQVQGASLDSLAPQTSRLRQMQNNYQSTVGNFPTCR